MIELYHKAKPCIAHIQSHNWWDAKGDGNPKCLNCGAMRMFVVPLEPDYEAAKREADRQQGGPGLSRHKVRKIVDAAFREVTDE